MERSRAQNEKLFERLRMIFPGIPTEMPQGSGGVKDRYFHLIVCTLELEGMDDLVSTTGAKGD